MMVTSTRRDSVRRVVDLTGRSLSVLAVLIALVPLVALLAWVIQQGGSGISWDFFTKSPPPQFVIGAHGGGMFPQIVGTLMTMGITSAMGIPMGILSGIYLARAGNARFVNTARFVTDVIAGTPSIMAGVLVVVLIVIPLHRLSLFAGCIALALLMFPTVTRATEAAIRAVPSELQEAALGLGAPEWRTIMRIVIPTAASGIVTAIILGVARVAGETAPLVLTTGDNFFLNTDPFNGLTGTLPVHIWEDSLSPVRSDHVAAFEGAFVLIMLVVVLNIIARAVTYRLSKRTRIA